MAPSVDLLSGPTPLPVTPKVVPLSGSVRQAPTDVDIASAHKTVTGDAEEPSTKRTKRVGKLPVTLLSGFLGAGKTTLLQHILTSNHGLGRVAVIVNDIGALNIDGALLSQAKVKQTTERLVEMQNGCICCTLRGDLLEEVAALAQEGGVDYLVIESTGISEPMQVAETFSEEFSQMHVAAAEDLKAEMAEDEESAKQNAKVAQILAAGGLPAISRLDTCVTLVDACNVFNDYQTADFLVDRNKNGEVPEEDDRCISDLMTDQLEFADVVICSKVDLVAPTEVERIRSLVHQLNPTATFIPAVKGQIDLSRILNTGSFSYAKAATSAGWLRSLQEVVKPETEEYGVGTFVYRARRPFHPLRLWKAIREVFVVIQAEPEPHPDMDLDIQTEYIDDGEESASGDDEKHDEDSEMSDAEAEGEDGDDNIASDDEDDAGETQPQLNPAARLASKKASGWANLFRSKGFIWLATRPLMFGEWSQAGCMLTLNGGGRWRCEVPEEDWPQDPEIVDAIKRDFEGRWADRRQELVFIGQGMRANAETGKAGMEAFIREQLDKCLLDDEEWKAWEKVMKGHKAQADLTKRAERLEEMFTDGFEDWPDDEDHTGHDHA